MLTLSRSGRFETLGDVSPFIYRLEAWLRMAGISYDSKLGSTNELIAEAPRGLIPFVDLDEERIGDSSIIISRLQADHNDPLNDGRLSNADRSLATLIKSVCEHELFYIMIYGRWVDGDAETFARFLFRDVPEDQVPMAIDAAKETVISGMLHGYRVGRYDAEFIRAVLREKLDVFTHYLGDKPYLFGDELSTIDAGFYSILASFIHFPLDNPHVQIAREYESLVRYCDRIKGELYPASDWAHGA